jgi:hypothetical protein
MLSSLENKVRELESTKDNKPYVGIPYKSYRRFILALHIVISILVFLSGPYLWYFKKIRPEVNIMMLPGLIWILCVTGAIYNLADRESQNG